MNPVHLYKAIKPIVSEPSLDHLSAVERSWARSFTSPVRVAEFVAGRSALRQAMKHWASQEHPQIVSHLHTLVIDRAADGAPVLSADIALPHVAYSISHTRSHAIAAVSSDAAAIGIDATAHEDASRVKKIAKKAFFHAEERALAMQSDFHATACWAIKESVAKALRIGMLEHLAMVRIVIQSVEPPRVTVRDVTLLEPLQIHLELHPFCVVAYTLVPSTQS